MAIQVSVSYREDDVFLEEVKNYVETKNWKNIPDFANEELFVIVSDHFRGIEISCTNLAITLESLKKLKLQIYRALGFSREEIEDEYDL